MDPYTGVDSVGVFLSGGASNYSSEDSLGGEISSKSVMGMLPIYTTPVQGLIIEEVTSDNGEGEASIAITGDDAVYTPPDGAAGSAVEILEGERVVLLGSDTDKSIRVRRIADQTFAGVATFLLRDVLNGVFSMGNVDDDDRQAGSVVYRAVFLKAFQDVEALSCWITTDGQSTFELAVEDPDSNDALQSISSEEVAPSGLAWEAAMDESAAIIVGDSDGTLLEDDIMGLWIKRTFPAAGVVSAKETVRFHLQFLAG